MLYRLSWRWKLPLLFAAVTVLTVTAFGIVAYNAVRISALEATATRFRSALAEINTITELGAINQVDQLRSAAADPVLQNALLSAAAGTPSRQATSDTSSVSAASSSTIAVLERLKGKSDAVVVAELIAPDGKMLYSFPTHAGADISNPAFVMPPDAAIGPMYSRDTLLYFQGAAPVHANGAIVGGVRVTRKLGPAAANRRIISNSLGSEAALLLGNANETMFKNGKQVDYPSGPSVLENTLMHYTRDNTRWVSSFRLVKSTPWRYAVELPERVALAPARALLAPFAATAALIAIAGALFGYFVSRRITTPLIELTAATEAIARGDRNVQLVATNRADEIGRLARTFRTMAASVRNEVERLESEVDVRTGEWRTAVDGLQHLHEELRQSERLATLGRRFGSVGHELRNPLGVMSNVVMLLDALPDASPRLSEYAGLLREQIRLSQRIISDLLDQARTGAPVLTSVGVPQLLDELLERAAIPTTIAVDKRYEQSLPNLMLDRDQIGQIVWNLITNAVQATPDVAGTLVVVAAFDAGHLRIEVQDSGKGVPVADRERIFEPMFTTKAHGVGLGLSISRVFARANGGELYVKDECGGACLVLDLPAVVAAES